MTEHPDPASPVAPGGLETLACAREPIHAPGAIQPHGALLAFDLVRGRVTHASANLGALLGVAPGAALGRPIADVLGEEAIPMLTLLEQRARASAPGQYFEARDEIKVRGGGLYLRAHGSGPRICIDIEPLRQGRHPGSLLTGGLSVIESLAEATSRLELCQFAARSLRSITGFDHVMAYRFVAGGHGEVIAEAREEGLPSYLGLRFPAGDVPPQARQLYLRQRVGHLEDRDAAPAPLLADPALVDDAPLDLTRSALRALAPVHLEYMRNMGTVATLRISLVSRGDLWGLLVCNHMSPRAIDPRTRTFAELLGHMISAQIGSLGEAESHADRLTRSAILRAIVDRLATPARLIDALAANSELLDFMNATGAVLRGSGRILTIGRAPPEPSAERILAVLAAEAAADFHAVDDLAARHPEFADCAETASGALLSWLEPGCDGDAIVWLRPEQARTVVWGGDPSEHVRVDRATGQLHPRASFSAWLEIERGRSEPWTVADLALAGEFRRAIEIEASLRTKAKLAFKSNILEVTLQHMNQGIMMIDADHRIQVCNDRAARSLDLAKSLLDSRPGWREVVEALSQRGSSADDGLERELLGMLSAAGIADAPRFTQGRGADGIFYEMRTMPMPGGGFVSTFADITVRKETEARLREARDQAQAATRTKSEFLATMSHEIRSPLSGLLGVIELLRETNLEPEQLQMANMAHGSAMSLLAVLNDILTFSKIEAKGLSIVPEPVGLRDLVGAVVEPHKLGAARKGVELTWRFDREMPDCVFVDPLRLRQILNNLLSNAVKFTLAGGIDLSVERDPREPIARMSFTVRDSGVGMTEAVLDRLFEPFVQADASTTRDFGGTGLGLSISSRLARLLGGTLEASSVFGRGSAFVLTLPLSPTEMAHVSVATDAEPEPVLAAEGLRLLVVDDDPSIRWLTTRQLELLGVRAEAAENGERALERLRAGPFDLVLTDCHMPRMDGIALTQAIRVESDARLRALPVVGLTADVTESQRARAFEAGMAEVAIKPLSRRQLSNLLARHLPSAATSVTLEPPAPVRASVAFDAETFTDVFERDDPEGRAWLADYFAMAESLVGDLRRLVDPASEAGLPRQEIAEAAHALAGASLSVGAARLGEEARALQHEAAGNPMARLVERTETLRDELAAARKAVSEFFGER